MCIKLDHTELCFLPVLRDLHFSLKHFSEVNSSSDAFTTMGKCAGHSGQRGGVRVVPAGGRIWHITSAAGSTVVLFVAHRHWHRPLSPKSSWIVSSFQVDIFVFYMYGISVSSSNNGFFQFRSQQVLKTSSFVLSHSVQLESYTVGRTVWTIITC